MSSSCMEHSGNWKNLPKIRLKILAALDAFLRPQLDKWEWLHPIHDYITVEIYDEEDYEQVEKIQDNLRADDDRYRPIGNVHF